MIYLTPCSPGKKVTYSNHDIPDTLLTWQKSNLFWPWYTWHPAHLAKKLLILTMIYLTHCSPGKKVTYSHHDIPDTLLTWQKSYLFSPWYTWLNCSPGKKVTYSHHDILDTLLTWQKSNLFSPWYTWHPAHLAKKLFILTMIYLTPCSPGKKVTYSDHDIPDSTAHLAKK
jgi:hypothetical protein